MQPTEYITVSLDSYEALISLCMIGWSLLLAAMAVAIYLDRNTRA